MTAGEGEVGEIDQIDWILLYWHRYRNEFLSPRLKDGPRIEELRRAYYAGATDLMVCLLPLLKPEWRDRKEITSLLREIEEYLRERERLSIRT